MTEWIFVYWLVTDFCFLEDLQEVTFNAGIQKEVLKVARGKHVVQMCTGLGKNKIHHMILEGF